MPSSPKSSGLQAVSVAVENCHSLRPGLDTDPVALGFVDDRTHIQWAWGEGDRRKQRSFKKTEATWAKAKAEARPHWEPEQFCSFLLLLEEAGNLTRHLRANRAGQT